MNVAEQYPPCTDDNGVTWFRPARDAGTDFSQWGWTSQREQAHPDYRGHYDAQTGGLHPERLCGGDCSGCVSEAEGAPPYRWGFPQSTERPAEVRPLPGGGFALVPVDPLPTDPLDPLPAEFVSVGYIDETRRGPHTVVHTGTGETAQCAGPAGCLPCLVTETEAPVQAKAEERADAYGRALSQLFELAATIDDTQGALW
ncbi:hypothetical protein SEA_SOSEPH_74 [Mycobacterium phage SoSeph]|nr:hypothetical protein SEA_SOSEPH_74 [Mycobacterium phage SoSeph]WNM65544.1 hypothetical protein SEA_HEFTYBOY_74 [Mycobacterium phage Heftyboy]